MQQVTRAPKEEGEMDIWETLSNNGSPLGALLLVYGTICYALSSGRAKVEPFNRSLIETSFFFTIIRLLSVPAFCLGSSVPDWPFGFS